ncbi:alpha-D-ribose 1-methylphosphonate 5-triphosphate synthase subunit PhnG [Rhodovulum adriaticum]|uniref:Alpha-D-ribose 1-methylphosphonate 5-triphosphate synthase subunit PhnG n=2 Tax=Rhodovulum adriaticum TaxID=35804 RepID=A0A4R2NN66_RHOAD|nr:alpha-D-ribose 1-methylphosphonate 5-triphosphate synthase subunit PhnG [Rhodovulum adriaticum]
MGLLSRAPADRLEALWKTLGIDDPAFHWLRAPETGGVMVRGRMGGTGAPFNLGEMTVTRCALRLKQGADGHAYVQGRDKAKARRAALVDALMQTDRADDLRRGLLAPLAQDMADAAASRAARAEATKVAFFTMVRGED